MAGVNSQTQSLTAMTLRASYATSMLHEIRNGRLGEGRTEDNVLELTGKQMNSSVEQLGGRYDSSYRSDYGEKMNLITRNILLVMEAKEGDDSDLIGPAAQSCGPERE